MGNERRLEGLTLVLAGGLLLALAIAIFGRGGAAAAPRAVAITLLGLLATLSLVLARFLPPPFRARPGAIGWFFLALLGLAALGLWRTFYLHASLNVFAVWAAAIAAYVTALVAGSRAGSNEGFRVGVLLLGALAAAAVLLPPLAEFSLGGGGTFVNANHIAALLASVLPVALASVVFAGRRWRGRLGAAVGGTSALLCATGLLVTGSRGGIIAAGAGLLSLALLTARTRPGGTRRGKRGAAWVIGIGAVAAMIAIQAGGEGFARFRPAEAGSESSMGFRLSIWNSSLNAALEGGPLGWGPGTYGWVYPAYRRAGVPYRVDHAHNDWLEQTVELGWAFPLLGLGAAWALARRALATCRASSDRVAAGSAVAGLSGLVALGVHAMVDSPLQLPALLWLAAALSGLVAASGNIDRRAQRGSGPLAPGRVLRAAPAACVIATILVSIGPWREALADAAITRAGVALERLAMEKAVLEARGAVVRDPDSAEAHATLGRVLVGAREAGVGGRMALAEAQHAFARAVARNPRDADAHLDLAMTAAKRNDVRAARAAYDRAVTLDPVSGRIHEDRARFLLRAGETGEALSALRASVSADARGLSRVLPLLWDETADADLLHAVTPEKASARIHLGDFLETKGLLDAADRSFREAVALEAGGETALLRVGRLALRRGLFEDAIFAAGTAWQQGRGAPGAGRVLAAALAEAGDLPRAAAVYEALLARDPGDKTAARAVADIGRRLAQPQRGVEAWLGVTRARPADMDARLALARFYETVGQPENARREYERILRLTPENSEARTALLRMRQGRGEGAS